MSSVINLVSNQNNSSYYVNTTNGSTLLSNLKKIIDPMKDKNSPSTKTISPLPDKHFIHQVSSHQKIIINTKKSTSPFPGTWTFKTFMEKALYDPKFGYYSTGKAKIGINKDFETSPTVNNCLALQLVTQSYEIWKSMVKAGDIKEDEPFHIIEFGAGTGQLCKDILDNLDLVNDLIFKNNVRYHIGEHSPALMNQQKKLNQDHIDSGKLDIRSADARYMQKSFPEKLKGLVISNELPDAFPVYKIKLNTKKQIEVALMVPAMLHSKTTDSMPHTSTSQPTVDGNITQEMLDSISPEYISSIQWEQLYLSVDKFPEIQEFIREWGTEYLSGMDAGEERYLNLDIFPFMKSVSTILDKGFAITIDYGDNHDKKPDQSIRVYGGTSQIRKEANPANDIVSHCGDCDLTVSVNFTLLAEAGQAEGLVPVGFFHQDDLSYIMPNLMPDQNTYNVINNEKKHADFKMIVQQKEGTNAQFAINSQPLPVTFDELHSVRATRVRTQVSILNISRIYAKAIADFRLLFPTKGTEAFIKYWNALYGRNVYRPEIISAIFEGNLQKLTTPYQQELYSRIKASL